MRHFVLEHLQKSVLLGTLRGNLHHGYQQRGILAEQKNKRSSKTPVPKVRKIQVWGSTPWNLQSCKKWKRVDDPVLHFINELRLTHFWRRRTKWGSTSPRLGCTKKNTNQLRWFRGAPFLRHTPIFFHFQVDVITTGDSNSPAGSADGPLDTYLLQRAAGRGIPDVNEVDSAAGLSTGIPESEN